MASRWDRRETWLIRPRPVCAALTSPSRCRRVCSARIYSNSGNKASSTIDSFDAISDVSK